MPEHTYSVPTCPFCHEMVHWQPVDRLSYGWYCSNHRDPSHPVGHYGYLKREDIVYVDAVAQIPEPERPKRCWLRIPAEHAYATVAFPSAGAAADGALFNDYIHGPFVLLSDDAIDEMFPPEGGMVSTPWVRHTLQLRRGDG